MYFTVKIFTLPTQKESMNILSARKTPRVEKPKNSI